jgi:peptidoglycan/xylan/chitin deacetylase (PgdA/CDA1 family)
VLKIRRSTIQIMLGIPLIISIIILVTLFLPTIAHSQVSFLSNNDNVINNSTRVNTNNDPRVVILNFDDSYTNQSIYVKPILDKYGFKATFFEVCNWLNNQDWNDTAALRRDGMDIQAHTMNHINLNKMPTIEELNFEIGQSKQCLVDHLGINPTIFAYPYGNGWNNATVVDIVAKYYSLARTDSTSPLTFLRCNDWQNHPQIDCRTYSANGTLTFANRYSINSLAYWHIVGPYSWSSHKCMGICNYYNNFQMFKRFVTDVNSQDIYNHDGIINAIPILVYHNFVSYPDISYSKIPNDTTVNLFEQEMKYLHDNGFKVLTMSDLGYDENSNHLYIKNKMLR